MPSSSALCPSAAHAHTRKTLKSFGKWIACGSFEPILASTRAKLQTLRTRGRVREPRTRAHVHTPRKHAEPALNNARAYPGSTRLPHVALRANPPPPGIFVKTVYHFEDCSLHRLSPQLTRVKRMSWHSRPYEYWRFLNAKMRGVYMCACATHYPLKQLTQYSQVTRLAQTASAGSS